MMHVLHCYQNLTQSIPHALYRFLLQLSAKFAGVQCEVISVEQVINLTHMFPRGQLEKIQLELFITLYAMTHFHQFYRNISQTTCLLLNLSQLSAKLTV